MAEDAVPQKKIVPKSNTQKVRDLRERRKETHSNLQIMIRNETKEDLLFLSKLYNKTQTEIVEELIATARKNCGFNDQD